MSSIHKKGNFSAIVSAKKSHATKIQTPWFHNNLLKLDPLHRKPFTPRRKELAQHGVFGGTAMSTAHVPSLYYWLARRCGIGFTEAETLVDQGRLVVGGRKVTLRSDLEYQANWLQFEPGAKYHVELQNKQDETVSALDRRKHREYTQLHLAKGMNFGPSTDPRSFLHCIEGFAGTPSHIHSPGFTHGMSGIILVTNDISCLPQFVVQELGGYGTYRLDFIRGTPAEVKTQIAQQIAAAIKEQGVHPDCAIEPQLLSCVGGSGNGVQLNDAKDAGLGLEPSPLEEATSLLLQCNVFPSALGRELVNTDGIDALQCLSVGPVTLDRQLQPREARPLEDAELDAFFDYEGRLKRCRVIATLRSSMDDADSDDDEGPLNL